MSANTISLCTDFSGEDIGMALASMEAPDADHFARCLIVEAFAHSPHIASVFANAAAAENARLVDGGEIAAP